MDIKELNKSQLILLAVLLSFITSIATGITTVTLMQQAPTSVVTPINRVVQQTIEKIQQVQGTTTTQTVVVKEEDLVVDAIAKNQSSVFSVTKEGFDADGNTGEVSAGRGFVVSNEGIVVADAILVPGAGVYYVKNSSGKFKADFVSTNAAGFSMLKIGEPVDGKSKVVYSVPAFGDLSKMKVGQNIIILGNSVATSIFEGLDASKSMSLNVTKGNAGGLVLNLDGEVIGIALFSEANSFASISTISAALKPVNTASVVNQ